MAVEIHATPGNRAAEIALALYSEALSAVRADRLMRAAVRVERDVLHADGVAIRLSDYRRVLVVGAGKASALMAAALEEMLPGRIAEGIVSTRPGSVVPTRVVRVLEAGHPIPDEASLKAGAAIHRLADSAGPHDLVVCLLSGGASALMELPAPGISLQDLQTTTSLLLRAGAPIQDLNAVRACLSRLKAGGLARAASPARVLCLVISDVLGNRLDVIGSGPCWPVPAREETARQVLSRYGVEHALPSAVRTALAAGAAAPEARGQTVEHVIIGDLSSALDHAEAAAAKLGMRVHRVPEPMTGEAAEVGRSVGAAARSLGEPPQCLLAGGETTVTVRGSGLGGRCQELALAAALEIEGLPNLAVLAAGTDGVDGPTDAAGALVDGRTLDHAGSEAARNALNRNDSYAYLRNARALIFTGPTQTNVNDLIIAVRDSGA